MMVRREIMVWQEIVVRQAVAHQANSLVRQAAPYELVSVPLGTGYF